MGIKKLLRNKKLFIFGAIGVVMIGFLTWFLISLLTLNTDLQITLKYDFPSAASVKNLKEVDARGYAVAIDGDVIAGKSINAGENYTQPTASTANMILGLAIMKAKPAGKFKRNSTVCKRKYFSKTKRIIQKNKH